MGFATRSVAVTAAGAAAAAAGIVLLLVLYTRSRCRRGDRKPQSKFRRVLADNSYAAFVHLSRQDTQEESSHPYAEEIRNLAASPPSFVFPDTQVTSALEDPSTWIDTREMLHSLLAVLSQEPAFAVDTEQHSLRSFLGFTALVQISTFKHDYLLDAIALHDDMHILAPVFADPSICKVFHGADSDILWLQRDFHIYVVNLFDTARACDVLGKSQRSLAYLLQTYCNVSTNKVFQRADWRQRPLPDDMLLYARMDAHFLLHIARCLHEELLQGAVEPENAPMLMLAMRRSQLICLQLYEKDRSMPATVAASLLARFHLDKVVDMSQAHEAKFRKRLKALCEWRDIVARTEDENPRYVLSDAALLEVALAGPSSPDLILSTIAVADNGRPPSTVVTKHIDHVIRILEAVSASSEQEPEPERVPQNGFAKSRRISDSSKISKVSGFKRLQFVKKFSCKGVVYENCRIYAGDGRLLCYCDRKKLEWYLQRGLATAVDDEVPAIRLCFEPKGRPEDENNEFYTQSKSNQCVGCGESSHYLRYRIIPSCYRQHFPEYLKSHRSHDIVLLCVDCHEVAHRTAEKYKHVIAAEYDVPLFAKRIVDGGGDDEAVVESEEGVSPLQLRNAAIALLCHGQHMPQARREELELLISAFFGGRDITLEDLKAAAIVGIDPRGQKRLIKKLQKIVRSKQRKAENDHSQPKEGVESSASKKSKISLLGHGLHGKKVVETIWTQQGEQGIRDFIQKWRVAFVEAVRPAYLPAGWDVAHSGHREFGEHSVYKPKWESGT